MKRRTALLGVTVGLAGTVFALDRVFNPKTPINYPLNAGGAKQDDGLTPACGEEPELTLSQTEGPYYTPKTPKRVRIREQDTIGRPLRLTGRVLDQECRPISGAVLDFWSCDGNGDYDNEGYRLRGHQYSDDTGAYELETIVPASYGVGFFSRTPHIHVKVQGAKTSLLTTQLYFPGETLNKKDGIFDDRLLVQVLEHDTDHMVAEFDFVLAQA